jgi:hypothetical protein
MASSMLRKGRRVPNRQFTIRSLFGLTAIASLIAEIWRLQGLGLALFLSGTLVGALVSVALCANRDQSPGRLRVVVGSALGAAVGQLIDMVLFPSFLKAMYAWYLLPEAAVLGAILAICTIGSLWIFRRLVHGK